MTNLLYPNSLKIVLPIFHIYSTTYMYDWSYMYIVSTVCCKLARRYRFRVEREDIVFCQVLPLCYM